MYENANQADSHLHAYIVRYLNEKVFHNVCHSTIEKKKALHFKRTWNKKNFAMYWHLIRFPEKWKPKWMWFLFSKLSNSKVNWFLHLKKTTMGTFENMHLSWEVSSHLMNNKDFTCWCESAITYFNSNKTFHSLRCFCNLAKYLSFPIKVSFR